MTFDTPDYDSIPPGTVDLHLTRRVYTDSSYLERRVTLHLPISTSAIDSTRFWLHLGSPLDDSLLGTWQTQPIRSSTGTWSCPPSWPLGTDSLLQARGYRATPAPTGTWSTSPRIPIG